MARKRTQYALYNMIGSLFYSLLLLFSRFIIRRQFLNIFGVEILGYNSTFHSILNMLNLAELGIGTAILYNLYSPIVNNEYEKISNLLDIYKKLYKYVGVFILAVGVLITPLLPLLVKENYDKLSYLSVIFVLQMFSTVATYWCAYKRILINAYQRAYIAYIADAIVLIFVSVLQIIEIKYIRNYYIYLILAIVQVVVSNIILSIWCNKTFTEINYNVKNNKIKFSDLRKDISNVLISKLGGYILNSTDALVVSVILGAIQTGYMTNYSMVFTSFQTIALTMLTTLQPSLGNKIACGDSKKQIEKTIKNMSFFSHLIGCIFSVIAFFLIDDFIILWIGHDYVLESSVPGMFALNVYIFLIMYPISLLFGALGYFKYDKIVVLFAAILNIIISVILVYNGGIFGVLVGTTIALIIYWVSRAIILYKKYYCFTPKTYVFFIARSFVSLVISAFTVFMLEGMLSVSHTITYFIFKGLLYFVVIILINCVIFFKSEESNYLLLVLKNILKKMIRKQ